MTESKMRGMIELFLISAISLYFELLVIRWLSSEVRIFAYFKNMSLMASLFGLGLGLALSNSKHDFSRWFPAALLVLTSIICFAEPLHLVHVTFIDPVEHYLIGNTVMVFAAATNLAQRAVALMTGLAVIVVIFYLITFMFTCLGQRLVAF